MVVGKVKRVIIAYEACDAWAGLGEARHAASETYPLATAVFLRRPEPCSLWHVDWANPEPTEYGMALNQPGSGEAGERYRNAYTGSSTTSRAFLTGSRMCSPTIPGVNTVTRTTRKCRA